MNIELEHITYSYTGTGGHTPVLSDLSLSIPQGSFCVFIGASGAGKSTLLHIASLLLKPDTGQVTYGHTDTSTLTDNQLSEMRATQLGIVFQAHHLLPGHSVLDNILFRFRYTQVPGSNAHHQALAALTQVGLSHKLQKTPRELSGGEMQRLTIARAIASSPSILFADEPTGNLDGKNTKSVMQLLVDLNQQGMSVIMVTHDTTLLEYASNIYQINDGMLSPVSKALSGGISG